MEESDDVDKILFVHAQSIAQARGEPDLRKRVEAMERANAIAEVELEAAYAKMTERKESVLHSKSRDNTTICETERMAEVKVNDAEKVDDVELQQIERNLKDKVGLDNSKAFIAVLVDNEQLNDLKATKKLIEHNPDEEPNDCKEWEMEEHVETFEDMNGGIDDKFDVDGEADQTNEVENPDENSEAAAEDLSYPPCSTCVDADVYSEASVEKPKMFSKDKFHDAKESNKEVTQLERHNFSPENHVANLDVRKIRDEGKKQDKNKATKDDEKSDDVLKLPEIAKNQKDKLDLDDANAPKATVNNENELLDYFKTEKAELNAYEASTAALFLPMIDLNTNILQF